MFKNIFYICTVLKEKIIVNTFYLFIAFEIIVYYFSLAKPGWRNW
jgi:hypothetical protein